jgi:hypothetical protein
MEHQPGSAIATRSVQAGAVAYFPPRERRPPFDRGFLVVRPSEKAHIRGMTTTTRPGGLCGWSIWCASVAIFLAFCASAFGGANSGVSPQKKVQSAQKSVRKVCFAHWGSTAIPQPCDRIFGPVPTTTSPMQIVRR